MNYNKNILLPSNKKFGYSFAVIFLIIFIYLLYFNQFANYRMIFLILSITFFIISIFYDKVLYPLNVSWLYLGLFLGKIVSPIVLGVIFFLILTPISLFFKLIKRDALNLKNIKSKSMWKIRTKENKDLNYFRNQY